MQAVRGRGSTDLGELYAPVAADLARAQRIFRQELDGRPAYIAELCRHVEHFRGKQLRPALLLLAARACGQVTPAHPLLAAVVEMVHLATLVHDDVLDGGDLRRRRPTVNRRWGDESAVLLGDLLFAHAYHLCSRLDSQAAARAIAAAAVTVCEGELLQIANRGNRGLREPEYLEIVTHKTATLVGLAAELGAEYAGADPARCGHLRAFGTALGIAFQITDDVLDLTGDERIAGKSLGRDVQHGELTLPLIHFLHTAPPTARAELRAVLGNGDGRRPQRVAALLAGSASLAYAREAAAGYVSEALAHLADLPPSSARESLEAMARFVLARQF